MAGELPPDILAEIFSRLSVKTLLRFRSTSKSLRSLIDSHKFINLHLKNSLNFNLILRHNTTDFYQLHFPNLTKSIIPLNDPFTINTDPFTRNPTDLLRNSKMALIGSCNGLLAISTGVIVFTHPNNPNEITIWNPNTRKHHIIPFLPLPIPILNYDDKCSLCVHGFGFDQLTGDYKLLRISYLLDLENPFYDPQVRLFSLKTNSWKIIPAMPYDLQHLYDLGVFVENSIHWIMTKKKLGGLHPCLIVAFNLTLEIFNEVPLPDEIGEEVNGESFEVHVAVLGECLCITVNYEDTKIDVWVMKEYGCRDSWCKLFTMAESCFDLPLKLLRPICYSSDGSKVLLERVHVLLEVQHRKLFWYDLKSEQVSNVEGIPPNMNETMFCVGSLVPPSLPVENTRKKENHTSKRRDDFLSRGFKLRL